MANDFINISGWIILLIGLWIFIMNIDGSILILFIKNTNTIGLGTISTLVYNRITGILISIMGAILINANRK